MTYYNKIIEATSFIENFVKENIDYAIVLGSGIKLELENQKELSYFDIPNFPIRKNYSTVKGHSNKITFGRIKNKNIMIFNGRLHYYEGYSLSLIHI